MVFIPSRPPYHRQNRRRERPGARTRKALSIRESIRHDYEEGISVARDLTIVLPAEKYPACSCSWAYNRNAIRGEIDADELESEQRRLFGGDVGDDLWLKSRLRTLREQELRRMGILYKNGKDVLSKSETTLKPEDPPEFSIRPARPKRNSRVSRIQYQLPEYLTSSLLSENPEIARWMLRQTAASSYPTRITVRHCNTSVTTPTPQSLPPSILNSVIPDISQVASYGFPSSPLLFPLDQDDEELSEATWDFITSSTRSSASPSEPETWEFLNDDS